MKTKKQKFENVFKRFTKNKLIHEAILSVENTTGDFSYSNEYGEKNLNTPFVIASVTKLFTTTCIFILKEQGKLSLDDRLTKYFPEDTLNKLHVYKGKEYSQNLTITNLLLQTSGLPDDFEEGSHPTKKQLIEQDIHYTFDDVLLMTKQQKPHFAPGMRKRAHYASINFDLLGKIIESVSRLPLEDAYKQFIFDPLELKNTYLPVSDKDFIPNIYYKDQVLYRPKAIQSSRASGGAISTASELMVFIKAFFGGKLFNKTIFRELEVNNRLQFGMFPIHYGAGFMRVPLGGIINLFMGKGELIGHSGSSGSFAFYFPRKDLFLVGDVNQVANPGLPVRLAMQLAMTLK